jgi:hypothetical protein
LKKLGSGPVVLGESLGHFVPSISPKHVAVKENIPFVTSSQLRVKPVQAVIEEPVAMANKSLKQETARLSLFMLC